MSGDNRKAEWSKMTEKEIRKIGEKDCKYCKNSVVISMSNNTNKIYACMYIDYHKQKRPCRPGECRKAGAFELKQKRR